MTEAARVLASSGELFSSESQPMIVGSRSREIIWTIFSNCSLVSDSLFRDGSFPRSRDLTRLEGITKMFPLQRKIELFAGKNYKGWDNWELEIPDAVTDIPNRLEIGFRVRSLLHWNE